MPEVIFDYFRWGEERKALWERLAVQALDQANFFMMQDGMQQKDRIIRQLPCKPTEAIDNAAFSEEHVGLIRQYCSFFEDLPRAIIEASAGFMGAKWSENAGLKQLQIRELMQYIWGKYPSIKKACDDGCRLLTYEFDVLDLASDPSKKAFMDPYAEGFGDVASHASAFVTEAANSLAIKKDYQPGRSSPVFVFLHMRRDAHDVPDPRFIQAVTDDDVGKTPTAPKPETSEAPSKTKPDPFQVSGVRKRK